MQWITFIFATISALPSPVAQIDAANARYVRAFQARDFALMASDYEENARFIIGAREIVGRRNLERFFAIRAAGVTLMSGTCSTTHLETDGPTATETGACIYRVRKGSARPIDVRGYYVTVWAYHAAEKRWFIRVNVVT
jgi:ketosteroid isomerase-like protein